MKMMTLYKQIIIKNTKMHLLAQFQGGLIVFLEIIGQKLVLEDELWSVLDLDDHLQAKDT